MVCKSIDKCIEFANHPNFEIYDDDKLELGLYLREVGSVWPVIIFLSICKELSVDQSVESNIGIYN